MRSAFTEVPFSFFNRNIFPEQHREVIEEVAKLIDGFLALRLHEDFEPKHSCFHFGIVDAGFR